MVTVFNVVVAIFNDIKKTINFNTFIKYIVWSSIIPIIFGLYQIQYRYAGFQLSIIDNLISFISGNVLTNTGRLSYFQSEPAYAGVYLNIVLFLSFINSPFSSRFFKYIYSSIILLMIFFLPDLFLVFLFFFLGSIGYLFCHVKVSIKYILFICLIFLFTGVSFF